LESGFPESEFRETNMAFVEKSRKTTVLETAIIIVGD
jgi:hypothetical protein